MIKKRKIFFIFSGILLLISVASISIWGLNFGIEFTGGSLLEVKFSQERPAIGEIKEFLKGENLNSLVVQPSGEDSYILRFQETEETVHRQVVDKLYELDEDEIKIVNGFNKK